MSETAARIGLIRCPNCQKLLPDQLKDHSDYFCGNCDAVLRAKRTITQTLAERIDERMFGIGGISERSSAKSEETRFYKNGRYRNYDNNNNNNISSANVFVDSMFPNGLQRIEEEERYQMDRFDGIGYRDDERAELLRKLDELRDQITRTCHVTHKPNDNRMVSHYSFPYMNDHHARNELYHSYSSYNLSYREHSSSSNQLSRGLQHPYYNAPPLYTDRNRVHTDSFDSYPPLPIMYHDHTNNWFPRGHTAYDEGTLYDLRSVHEVQDSHYFSAKASHSESHSGQMSRVLTSNNGHIRQPIVGGAPFLTCQNCFELLLLPKKVFFQNENEKKVKCGSCSATMMIIVDMKRLEFLVLDEGNQTNENDDDEGSSKFLSEKSSCAAIAKTGFFNEDSDNSSSKLTSHSTCSFSSDKLEKAVINENEPISSSRSTFPAIENEPNSTETAHVINSTTPPPRGSTLQVYFDYSDKFKLMKHIDKGEGSGQCNKLGSTRMSGISMQNSVTNGSETEIDVPSNEFPNAGTSSSLDCGEESKKALGGDKVLQLLESCFEDKVDVTINGNVMPYALIKRAEKLAGPIYPGHYWYDFRAGFWGVMGGPCLGIVPPFIEEFNCPMPKSCTGGKTGVFVNGRELHEKDLSLLSRRGLPIERDRSYILEISGRVLDEVTGEELERLGKLAPTVERSNHGFGMRDPKATT